MTLRKTPDVRGWLSATGGSGFPASPACPPPPLPSLPGPRPQASPRPPNPRRPAPPLLSREHPPGQPEPGAGAVVPGQGVLGFPRARVARGGHLRPRRGGSLPGEGPAAFLRVRGRPEASPPAPRAPGAVGPARGGLAPGSAGPCAGLTPGAWSRWGGTPPLCTPGVCQNLTAFLTVPGDLTVQSKKPLRRATHSASCQQLEPHRGHRLLQDRNSLIKLHLFFFFF